MKENLSTDTIAAIATARGLGGIGIIRVSGSMALPILQSMFSRKARSGAVVAGAPGGACSAVGGSSGAPAVQHRGSSVTAGSSGCQAGCSAACASGPGAAFSFEPRKLEYGWILDAAGQPLDEVLAVYMPGPRTFSGEDIAEIHCHGGRAVMDAVLDSTLSRGARLAEPGEFTRRAFMNGRLDLSQAEAVAEMIAAPSLEGVYLARNKLEGRLGESLDAMRDGLDWLRARLYLAIDFPEDAEDEFSEGESAEAAEFRERIDGLLALIDRLVQAYERARVWRDGAEVALAGQVNVGKSSLLNAILGRKRALVADTPGTTRDFIEESVNLAGLPVRLVDTAGLRSTSLSSADELVEAAGIDMARAVFERADAILLVLPADRLAAALAGLCELDGLDNLGALKSAGASGPADSGPVLHDAHAAQSGDALPQQLLQSQQTQLWQRLEAVWRDLIDDFDPIRAEAAGLSREDVELLSAFGVAGANSRNGTGNAGGSQGSGSFGGNGRLAVVVNKLDLESGLRVPEFLLGCPCFGVSAVSGMGLDAFGTGIRDFITAGSGGLDFASEAAPNLRQSARLKEARQELEALKAEYSGAIPADLLSVRLDTVAEYLSEIIGSGGTEEVLDQVFSSFCIGK